VEERWLQITRAQRAVKKPTRASVTNLTRRDVKAVIRREVNMPRCFRTSAGRRIDNQVIQEDLLKDVPEPLWATGYNAFAIPLAAGVLSAMGSSSARRWGRS